MAQTRADVAQSVPRKGSASVEVALSFVAAAHAQLVASRATLQRTAPNVHWSLEACCSKLPIWASALEVYTLGEEVKMCGRKAEESLKM